jgi:hypothetical protein
MLFEGRALGPHPVRPNLDSRYAQGEDAAAVVKRCLVVVALLALLLATAAEAKVSLVRVTSPVSPGSYATLTVRVSRPARCSITVVYYSGPSEARGLYPKRSSGGKVSWTWKVGTRTTAGRWPIRVNCGAVGFLRTPFRVT